MVLYNSICFQRCRASHNAMLCQFFSDSFEPYWCNNNICFLFNINIQKICIAMYSTRNLAAARSKAGSLLCQGTLHATCKGGRSSTRRARLMRNDLTQHSIVKTTCGLFPSLRCAQMDGPERGLTRNFLRRPTPSAPLKNNYSGPLGVGWIV